MISLVYFPPAQETNSKRLTKLHSLFFVLWNLVWSNFLQLSYCRPFKAQKSLCKVLISTLKANLNVFWDSLKLAFLDISLLDSTTQKNIHLLHCQMNDCNNMWMIGEIAQISSYIVFKLVCSRLCYCALSTV